MIYFDSAATSFQKPASVAAAMWEALASMSSPGRGGYPAAARAADTAFQCRSELAELFGLKNPEQVVFTFNATHALNIAIKSLVRPGGKVVVSGYEHNAVPGPWRSWERIFPWPPPHSSSPGRWRRLSAAWCVRALTP